MLHTWKSYEMKEDSQIEKLKRCVPADCHTAGLLQREMGVNVRSLTSESYRNGRNVKSTTRDDLAMGSHRRQRARTHEDSVVITTLLQEYLVLDGLTARTLQKWSDTASPLMRQGVCEAIQLSDQHC